MIEKKATYNRLKLLTAINGIPCEYSLGIPGLAHTRNCFTVRQLHMLN